MLCYMRMTINTNDDLALKRIINTPTRGIGKTTITRLEEIAQFRQWTLWEAPVIFSSATQAITS